MNINVAELRTQTASLPREIPDFARITPVPQQSTLSDEAKKLLGAFKPLLDTVDWSSEMAGAPAYRKTYETTAKLVVAQMLRNVARLGNKAWTKEATLAGTDIPSYARQMVKTILRAYPRLYTLQLFGVVPFSGPDGRVFFRDYQYNSVYTGSSPNIASADRTDDLSKFNPNYFKVSQGAQARKLKMAITSMTASVDSYRVTGEWTYEAEDDLDALYNTDAEEALVGHMSMMMQWVTDRTMLNNAIDNVPNANKVTWNAAPSGYASLAPSEQRAYDETLFKDGILKVITAIQGTRAWTITPNWAIAGPVAAEKLMGLRTFVPVTIDPTSAIDLNTGSIRDIGTFQSLGLRVLVDPQYTTNKILFGRRPTGDFDPSIIYCPYRPLRTTGVLEQPGLGTMEKGVYSRFAAVVPDTEECAASSQLVDCYGELTLSNAS